jgi:hypothetical protein
VELVPEYISFQPATVTPCVYRRQFDSGLDPTKYYARVLAADPPTSYRVTIGLTAFEGRIDGFPGERTVYDSYVDEGTPDCVSQP